MISANELRIGNWVVLDWDGQLGNLKIIGVNDYDGKDKRVWFEEHDDFSISCIYPIPLTPEILIAAGFEYLKVKGIAQISDDFDTPEGDTFNWTKRVTVSAYCDSFNFEIVKWGKDQKYFTFCHQWLRVRFLYVHQLQNLYFALTGTELKINL